jgi:hypothetical protein
MTCLLRPLQEGDVENLLNSPSMTRNLAVFFTSMQTVKEFENYIQLAIKAREKGPEFPFIVLDKKTTKYADGARKNA